MTRSRTWPVAITLEDAPDNVDRLTRNFEILEDGTRGYRDPHRAVPAIPIGGKQVHDVNIVATVLAHRTRRLPTFNTADFRRYGDRIELVDTQSNRDNHRRGT